MSNRYYLLATMPEQAGKTGDYGGRVLSYTNII
jgi:hypothetical protein